jgi:large subunit ribosomal protein L29
MPLKAHDLQELGIEELTTQAESLRARLFDLRSRQARKELEGGLEIRTTRRDLARVLTIIKQKSRSS